MTTVDDISRYDGTAGDLTPDRCDEAIFNVEDPGCIEKVKRWDGEFGKPWHLYGWEYPGPGSSAVPLLHSVADALGKAPKAGWVDYEQNGVGPGDGWAAHDAAAGLGFPCGFYTYLYMLNSQAGLADVWGAFDLRWIAYYPGNNSGAYPASEIGSAQYMGAALWQYTSSNGTRDRNVVVDDARWATLGGAPKPVPIPPEEDDMPYISEVRAPDGRYMMKLADGGRCLIDFGLADVGAPFGVPASWVAWKAQDPARDDLKRIDLGTAAYDALVPPGARAAAVDPAALAAALLPHLKVTVDDAAIAKAVSDQLAQRLAA